MSYTNVKDLAVTLSDDDKLKLAHYLLGQVLIDNTSSTPADTLPASADYDYCLERVLKSKPNRLAALRTFLEAIFSFRGGLPADVDDIIKRLELKKVITISGDHVTYL